MLVSAANKMANIEQLKELEIKEKIKTFIVNNFLLGVNAGNLNDSDSFLDKGIVDSTGILEVVSFIEESFSIKVEDEELLPDNLDSINHLVNFVQKKQNKG